MTAPDALPPPVPLTECGVLILGGTSGTGLATAHAFAAAGTPRLVLAGRDAARGVAARDQVRAAHPGALVEFVACDALEPDQALATAARAESLLGGIDVLVNSVSSAAMPNPFHADPIELIRPTLLNQALPPLHMCRAVIPGMRARRRGAIVTLSSDAAKVATPGEAVVGAAMAAVTKFSQALALEAKRYGVRVNVITPSLIGNTPSHDTLMRDAFAGKLFGKVLAAAHLGMTVPEDIAPLIVFLASPAAARITGQTISVNGGISVA